ncbi:uncharacterized protein K441DRAFT_537732, partial [Cenococcum geophilum 1.58]|uniref:uncharacterized protein n=1 Tax=Cenococcum geophilum 1.58 TaxID=794803 RepID=UPI00358F278D
ILLLLLFSVAIAIKPDALVESASTKGSNKAVYFKNINIIVIYSKKHSNKSTVIVNINLEYIKNKEKDSKP